MASNYYQRIILQMGTVMNDLDTRIEHLMDRLRQRQCRMTPQRVALVRLLAASKGHPSAADLYEQLRAQFPTTSLATVYKTLALLDEMGEVLSLQFGDSTHYDGNKPYPHPHLICLRCRKIGYGPQTVGETLQQQAAKDSGFRITGHRLDFYGLCPDCQALADGARPEDPLDRAGVSPRGGNLSPIATRTI